MTAAIDREIAKLLAEAKIAASPPADDDEFLRRATLDIAGRIPTRDEAERFLSSADPDKRRALIDTLLASPDFGQNFGTIWKRLIVPRQIGTAKTQVDRVTPWLAGEFNRNRGWNEIVYELLTTEGSLARDPQTCFLAAGSEGLGPRPNLLAASTARLFLGVQLACAECHNHPFAQWQQTDFWGLAAFFGQVHKRSKMDDSLTEDPVDGAAIAADIKIPDGSGPGSGQVVAAQFLGGVAPEGAGASALRPVLASWITSPDNPYFARAMVNRLWAHFFGRGLVVPLDGFQEGYAPSHPEALDRLSAELIASGYDVQHLIRCLCATEAYRRSGRPTPENESDVTLLSHMPVKPLSPDVLFNALTVAVNGELGAPPPGKQGGTVISDKPLIGTRDEFVNFFSAAADESSGGQYTHGIPQLLRLMNAEVFNTGTPLAAAVADASGTVEERIGLLYLSVLSRHPTEEETRLLADYVTRQNSDERAYAGAVWILLNTSEFVLNR